MKFSTYAFLLLLTLFPQFANAESIGSKATAYIQLKQMKKEGLDSQSQY